MHFHIYSILTFQIKSQKMKNLKPAQANFFSIRCGSSLSLPAGGWCALWKCDGIQVSFWKLRSISSSSSKWPLFALNLLFSWTISTILLIVSAFIIQLSEFSLSLTLVQSSFYIFSFQNVDTVGRWSCASWC